MKTRRKIAGYISPAVDGETYIHLEEGLLARSIIHNMDEVSIGGQMIEEFDATEDFDNSWY